MGMKILKTISGVELAGPYRNTAWRHQEASELVAQNRAPSPRLHDEVTMQLADYYRQRRECQTPLDHLWLKRARRHCHGAR